MQILLNEDRTKWAPGFEAWREESLMTGTLLSDKSLRPHTAEHAEAPPQTSKVPIPATTGEKGAVTHAEKQCHACAEMPAAGTHCDRCNEKRDDEVAEDRELATGCSEASQDPLDSSWELQHGGGWRHSSTGDQWDGEMCQGIPRGKGNYVFTDSSLKVHGFISGMTLNSLAFSGQGSMEWPDGSSYVGELEESAFSGNGKFVWSNGDQYEGQWKSSKRHGKGVFLRSSNGTCAQDLSALGLGELVHCSRYEGEWMDDLMHGKGKIEYLHYRERTDPYHPESSRKSLLKEGGGYCAGKRAASWEESSKEVIRRFTGIFKKGFPIAGCLENKNEKFEKVIFDGSTHAGGHAVWYWMGSPDDESRGSRLIDLDQSSEEFRAVKAQFTRSMPASMNISSIQRVQNDTMRIIFDMQRHALEKKVMAPPRSRAWNPRTMERWAFHAPGSGSKTEKPNSYAGGGWALFGRRDANAANAADVDYRCAAPWESIVEEGFQATLAGSENGRAYGSGVYFARDAKLSDRYAQKPAALSGQMGVGNVCRVFLTRIITGIYTQGSPGMSQPPLDPNGARGEHFHSLVDNVHDPSIFVIPDNSRAYPAYLVSYENVGQGYRGGHQIPAPNHGRVSRRARPTISSSVAQPPTMPPPVQFQPPTMPPTAQFPSSSSFPQMNLKLPSRPSSGFKSNPASLPRSGRMAPSQAAAAAAETRAAAAAAAAESKKSDSGNLAAGKGAGGSRFDFLPAGQFNGSKAGYVFKKGSQGLGYYLDTEKAKSTAVKRKEASDFCNSHGASKRSRTQRGLSDGHAVCSQEHGAGKERDNDFHGAQASINSAGAVSGLLNGARAAGGNAQLQNDIRSAPGTTVIDLTLSDFSDASG